MTTQEWIADSKKMLGLINEAKFMLPVVQPTHNEQVQRVFSKGIAGDGNKIGTYSTKVMLASKDQFVVKTAWKQSFIDPDSGNIVKSPAEGDVPFWLTFKNRKTGVKNSKATPLMFLHYGYRQFKEIQGKESSFVNLRLSENLKIDYSNSLRFSNGIVTSSVHSKANVGKLQGAIDKYGTRTFELTLEEREKLGERFSKALIKNIRKT